MNLNTLLSKFSLLSLIALFIFLFFVASFLQVHYFDGYSILYNAKKIAGLHSEAYIWSRPPMMPMLLTPLFWIERLVQNPAFSVTASHFAAVGFFMLMLFSVYKLFSLYLAAPLPILGITLLALNSLLIHGAPFAMQDIPATLLMCAAFYAYLTTHEQTLPERGRKIVTSLLIAAAMLTRYNLIPLIFLVICSYEFFGPNGIISTLRKKERLVWTVLGEKIMWYFVVPCLLFLVVPGILLSTSGVASWRKSPAVFVNMMIVSGARYGETASVPPIANYIFLKLSCTWPILICGLWGGYTAWKKKIKGRLFFSLWLLYFFVFQTYVLGHKEARYLIPLLPALYYFVTVGVSDLFSSIQAKAGRWIKPHDTLLISVLFFILLLIWPLRNAFAEGAKFLDPFYKNTFAQDVSRLIRNETEDHQIFWVGPMHLSRPAHFPFHPLDTYAYTFAFHSQVVLVLEGKLIFTIGDTEQVLLDTDAGLVYTVMPSLGQVALDGDLVVVSVTNSVHENRSPHVKPIAVQKIRSISFELQRQNSAGTIQFFNTPQSDQAELFTKLAGEVLTLQAVGIPEGYYEVLALHPVLKQPILLGGDATTGGKLTLKRNGAGGFNARHIRLVSYEPLAYFENPSTLKE